MPILRRCRFALTLAVFVAVAVLPRPAQAVLGDQYGVIVDEPLSTPAAFPILAEARFGWTRIFAWWQILEPQQNQYSFGYLDAQVASALAAGLKVDLVVASIPSWANGAPANCGIIGAQCSTPPTSTSFYYNFMTTLVAHYRGQVTYYELWNEPDISDFWNGSFSQYITDILENGANAVHATDSTAKVVGPSTVNKINDFEAAVNPACRYLDVLAAHFFPTSDLAADMFSSADSSFAPYIRSTCNKPFWITAYGVGSWLNGESFQAAQYAAAIAGVPSRSYIARLFLYRWDDGLPVPPITGGGGSGIVGSLTENYRRKLSFIAAQDAILANLGLPGVATTPMPRHLAVAAPIGGALGWTAGRNAAAHDVYFGAGTPTFRGQPPASHCWTTAAGRPGSASWKWNRQ
jgi:Beta-galactosidase